MAASGRRGAGAGETSEAIGALLAICRGRAASPAQVYAHQSFQWLTCAFVQLCHCQPPRPEERRRRVSKDAPRSDVAEGWNVLRFAALLRGFLSHKVRGRSVSPHEKARARLIAISEKQYLVSAGLARNCRFFFLSSVLHSRAHSLRSERGVI
jgi:hypothetical protein